MEMIWNLALGFAAIVLILSVIFLRTTWNLHRSSLLFIIKDSMDLR